MPSAGSNYSDIDFVLKKHENYYPQGFLKEYKYTIKGKRVIRYIADNLKIPSVESDEEINEKFDKNILKLKIAIVSFLRE